jgi:acetyl-CoA carboxylase carboxyl transferase subunit beta
MHFDKPTYSVRRTKKKDIPKGLYTKDPVTGEILFNKEIEDNLMVVPKSGHHFPIGARTRIAKLLDPGSLSKPMPISARATPSGLSTRSPIPTGSSATNARAD